MIIDSSLKSHTIRNDNASSIFIVIQFQLEPDARGNEADMSQNTALLLGGYGNTGRLISRLLLQETDVQLVIAGRNRA